MPEPTEQQIREVMRRTGRGYHAAREIAAIQCGHIDGDVIMAHSTGSGQADAPKKAISLSSGRVIQLDRAAAPELSGGEWRTINGAHVYIKDGKVAAGPAHLKGMKPEDIHGHGKADAKAKPGYHAIERDAVGNYVGTKGADGNVAHNPEHAERIKSLKIAPGYTKLHLAEDPQAMRQAYQTDSKGRETRVYSDAHTQQQSAAKFARVKKFVGKLPEIRSAIADHPSDEAAALRLIDQTGIRIGSDADTGAAKKAYGASTLRAEHVVTDESGRTALHFTGKKGVEIHQQIDDPKLAEELKTRAKSGGKLYNTNDAKVRDHLHAIAPGFKVKDFRTAVAADTAMDAMKGVTPPTNLGDLVKARKAVGEKVASKLGNTAAVALKSYIPPEVFAGWETKAANLEQAKLIEAHAAKTGQAPNDAARDWIKNNAAAYRDNFNKKLGKSKPGASGGKPQPARTGAVGQLSRRADAGRGYLDRGIGGRPERRVALAAHRAAEHLLAPLDLYRPDQPRDKNGRFVADPGGNMRTQVRKHGERADFHTRKAEQARQKGNERMAAAHEKLAASHRDISEGLHLEHALKYGQGPQPHADFVPGKKPAPTPAAEAKPEAAASNIHKHTPEDVKGMKPGDAYDRGYNEALPEKPSPDSGAKGKATFHRDLANFHQEQINSHKGDSPEDKAISMYHKGKLRIHDDRAGVAENAFEYSPEGYAQREAEAEKNKKTTHRFDSRIPDAIVKGFFPKAKFQKSTLNWDTFDQGDNSSLQHPARRTVEMSGADKAKWNAAFNALSENGVKGSDLKNGRISPEVLQKMWTAFGNEGPVPKKMVAALKKEFAPKPKAAEPKYEYKDWLSRSPASNWRFPGSIDLYRPDQPRDSNGRFTADPGGNMRTQIRQHGTRADFHERKAGEAKTKGNERMAAAHSKLAATHRDIAEGLHLEHSLKYGKGPQPREDFVPGRKAPESKPPKNYFDFLEQTKKLNPTSPEYKQRLAEFNAAEKARYEEHAKNSKERVAARDAHLTDATARGKADAAQESQKFASLDPKARETAHMAAARKSDVDAHVSGGILGKGADVAYHRAKAEHHRAEAAKAAASPAGGQRGEGQLPADPAARAKVAEGIRQRIADGKASAAKAETKPAFPDVHGMPSDAAYEQGYKEAQNEKPPAESSTAEKAKYHRDLANIHQERANAQKGDTPASQSIKAYHRAKAGLHDTNAEYHEKKVGAAPKSTLAPSETKPEKGGSVEVKKFGTYRLSGNTFAAKEDIKALGGKWDKPSKTWIVQTGGMKDIRQQQHHLEKMKRAGVKIEELSRSAIVLSSGRTIHFDLAIPA